MWFKKRERPESPSQYLDLSENLIAKIWVGNARDGSQRIHYALRRRAQDGGEPYVSLKVESLFELPGAISTLAAALASVPALSSYKDRLVHLANVISRAASAFEANGEAKEEKPASGANILNLG